MVHKRTLLALLCVFVLLFANAFAGHMQDSSSCESSTPSSSSQPQSSVPQSSSSSCESSTGSASQGEESSTAESSSCPMSSSQPQSSSSSSCGSEESSTASQSQGESSSTAESSCPSSSSSVPQSSSSSCASSSSQPQSSSSSCASSSQPQSSSSSSCASSSSQPQSSSSPSCSSSEPQSSSPSCSSSEPQSSSSPSCSSSEPQSSSSPSCSSSSSQPQSSSSSSCASSSSQPQSSSSSCASSSSSQPQSSSSSSCASSSSSQPQSSSSSCGSEESSTGSQSQGESSSTGIEESSTGNQEESQDCGRGTYSATGFKPCLPCANNTYANLRETECTPCPANTHIPDGVLADSLTRCVCDEGYTSLWASGGPCYPEGETPSYEYCGQRTYSETGNAPCEACPNNTYANYAETECHSCPDNSHILGGGVGISITECVCDDGYTSQWATGGPCYPIGQEQSSSSSTGEQGQGEESSTGIEESSSTGSGGVTQCSDYDTALSCKRDSACQPIYAHVCSCGKWKFVGCEDKDYCDNSAQNGTCAADSNGDRAWFPSRALPDGWNVVPVNKKCGACCKPDHQHHPHKPSKNDTNVGTGCSFVNGSACVLIEFRGECPATNVLNQWRINIIEAVATIVSTQLNVSRAEATIGLTVGAIPQSAGDNSICSVHLQIFPPAVGDLTANDFLMAIWQQLGGDSLISGNDVAGIAGVRTYGDLKAIDEADGDDTTITSGAAIQASVGMMAVATTSVIVSALW